MDIQKIKSILIAEGNRLWQSESSFLEFSGNKEYDALLSDIEHYPHAFVIGCLMSRQVKTDVAWRVPFELSQRLGNFRFSTLSRLSEDECIKHMTSPTHLHRYAKPMGRNLYFVIQHIESQYGGDASRIWSGNLSSAEIVYRFLQFKGVGIKIATMSANSLARDFKILMSDYYSIDISPDVHVQRVFTRLGLIEEGASNEELIYRARVLNPEYPGLLDLPAWQIGINWCQPKNPKCLNCYMKYVCSSTSWHI